MFALARQDVDEQTVFAAPLLYCVVSRVIALARQDVDEQTVFAAPLLYCHFAHGDGKYMAVTNFDELTKTLVETLEGYNEVNAAMNLVLFEDAIFHVLRISRILESPRGNALLIGVGGSGKQSLSRLASYNLYIANENSS